MPSAANQYEHRSINRYAGNTPNNQQLHDQKQITYVAAAAKHPDNTTAVYKTATFHTAEKDLTYSNPFEDIPHLHITGKYSGATLSKNEIVFCHIFERGQHATRETLHACRSYAIHAIRKHMDIALQHDQLGDPVIVVTKNHTNSNDWHLTGDIRVRFPSKRSVLHAYDQQKAPVKNADDNNKRLLTHYGHINPIIILTGHVGNESTEASLHKAFLSCELLRGKDSGELPTIFKDNLKGTYEEILLNDKDDFIAPDDFINTFITSNKAIDSINSGAVSLPTIDLLYLFEFSKIFKVSRRSSPYAAIEWPGVQIP